MSEKERKPSEQAWGTKQELAYIENIGVALNKREGREEGTKTQYLNGYLKSCKNRVNWGSIDKDVCVKMANEMLGKLINGY